MFKSRIAVFGVIIAILVVLNVVGYAWSNWGKVTLVYKDAPLQEVINSLQKQAGIKVKTNLDPTTKVTIRVIKKSFPEALEYLAGATDTNWKLTYVMAPAREDIAKFFDTWAAGDRPAEWRWIGRGGFGGGGGGGGGGFGGGGGGGQDDDDYVDPRENAWNIQPVESKELQGFLQQGNILTDAAFVLPTSWNPKVESVPSAAKVYKLAPKMAASVSGQTEEVFLLIGNNRPTGTADAGGQNQQRTQGGGGGGAYQFQQTGNDQTAAWREQRTQERLAKLPADKRVLAQAEIDQRRAMMEEMRKLTPEQRQAKMQEMMNDPGNQEKAEEQMAKRDSKSTPEQKIKRFQRYVERKKQILGNTAPAK